jgi:NAD(P)-dependent dehydrogenase (short-subunit alcohol dehydrogenase family)
MGTRLASRARGRSAISERGRRVVAISGAASGIGRALAQRFAAGGAAVALLDRDAAGIAELAGELPDALAVPLDVTDEAACCDAMTAVADQFGGIDVVVCCAGISQRGLFDETEMVVFRRVMDVNFFGTLHCTKAALPWIQQRKGSIVAISSVAGFAPLLGRSGYCASKHALHGLFDTLRVELAPEGVHVLVVCPGFTATAIERNALGSDGLLARHAQTRVGRQALPEQVAADIVRACEKRRELLVLSAVGRMSHLLVRLCPRLYARLMARGLADERTPREPRGA